MGQSECLKILNDNWQTTIEIAKQLKQKRSVVSPSLRKLFKQGLIHRKEYKEYSATGYIWRKK